MALIKFTRTDPGAEPIPVFINPKAVTSVMSAFTLRPGGSGITVYGLTYPILVDESPDDVANLVQLACIQS